MQREAFQNAWRRKTYICEICGLCASLESPDLDFCVAMGHQGGPSLKHELDKFHTGDSMSKQGEKRSKSKSKKFMKKYERI